MHPGHRSLLTVWGEHLDPEQPLPEYPRPQLRRDSYLNLNGRWEYAFSISGVAPRSWAGTIVVPFSPESALSGVGRQLRPGEYLHYRRTFTLPEGFRRDRVILHFGAVDQSCRVMVNDHIVGEHTGGYWPFSIDVTDHLLGGANRVHVVVTDPSDTAPGARGKQSLAPRDIWYTAQSGIWQTVWLESVPQAHITSLQMTPGLDHVDMIVNTSHPGDSCRIEISDHGAPVATADAAPGQPVRVDIADPRLWSPEDPHLYDVRVTFGEDVVDSYVGLRTFGTDIDADGLPRLLLNGRPYFHAGVLDQGYWSDGLYTAPADEAMVHDITTMKDLGFTMLRKHIKIEPLRWYYHCDRLGMLVWQDMVNGGLPYRRLACDPPRLPWRLRDDHYRLFGRADAPQRREWIEQMVQTVGLLGNSTSIAVWVPFNEGWGQFDAARAAATLRRIDPSREVDHASGWHDQGAGDVRSLHVYTRGFTVPRRGDDPRVLALTEYGGYSTHVSGHSAGEQDFGYRHYPTTGALTRAFTQLHEEQIVPAVAHGLGASVYTQLSDVEGETNGLLTYDRRVLKIPADHVRSAIAGLRL